MNKNIREKERRFLLFYMPIAILQYVIFGIIDKSYSKGVAFLVIALFTLAVYFVRSLNQKLRYYCFLFLPMASVIIYYSVNEVTGITALGIMLPAMLAVSILEKEELLYMLQVFCLCVLGMDFYWFHKIYFSDRIYLASYVYILTVLIVSMLYIVNYTRRKNEKDAEITEINRVLTEEKQSKDIFLSNVSHELRTPLNSVINFTYQMDKYSVPSEVSRDFENAKKALKRLETIVTDVLDYSSLQTGNFTCDNAEYNFSSIINDCINTAIAVNEKKRLEIIVNCDTSIPQGLIGDRGALRRIINNVMDNAIKFTDSGYIYFSARARKESYGVNLILSIKDTGCGIEKSQLDHIFEGAYEHLDKSADRDTEGMGLGLPLTRLLLSHQNGFIHVDSNLGEGTSVTMVIPQEVTDDRNFMKVDNSESKRIAYYDNIKSFPSNEASQRYKTVLEDLETQEGISVYSYTTIQELDKAIKRGNISHVLMTAKAYVQNWEIVDKISDKIHIIIIQDSYEEPPFEIRANFRMLYKPFYTASLVSILNGDYSSKENNETEFFYQFTAPDAKILVVDDSAMNIRVVESFLKPYKVKIYSAGSGFEAIDRVQEIDFDLILMDHMMPKMDGIECLHRIRELQTPYCKTVPVVALTANVVGGARKRFMDEGFSEYVSKPINLAALEMVLKTCLPENLIVKKSGTEGIINSNDTTQKKTAEDKDSKSQGGSEKDIPGDTPDGGQNSLIDRATGLKYSCDSEELYMALVQVYVEDSKDNMANMEDLFEKEDYKEYTVLTHALKSNSLQIGAKALSEEAKAMEMAGKKEDYDFIKNGHRALMEHYKKVLDEIAGWEV